MNDLKARIMDSKSTPFERFCLLMEILRSPQGCAWDRAQTHSSLLPYLIEETYEVVEAVEKGDAAALKDELGDLLCQVVFHAQLARERGDFDINDSINHIIEKLIRRHPHVFGEKNALDPQQVRDQWEKIKASQENKGSILSGLPESMPALTMAFRAGEKASGVGFDWNEGEEVLEKVEEEIAEVKEILSAQPSNRHERLSEEIGDLLFSVSSLARKLDVDPERALKIALRKFRTRFAELEKHVAGERGNFESYSLEELESIWQDVKKRLQQDSDS